MINLVNIGKTYDKNNVSVFENFNLKINSGEMVAVMGRSGSGKSTLLGIISGLIPFNKGEYYFFDKKLVKKKV